MRWSIALLLLILSTPAWTQFSAVADSSSSSLNRPAYDQWFGQDKAHHFMVSAFLTGLSYYAVKQEFAQSQTTAAVSAVSFSLSAGVAKEIYDAVSGKGTPSCKDIVADVAGVAVGFLILNISSL